MNTDPTNAQKKSTFSTSSIFSILLPTLTFLLPITLSILFGYNELWPDLLLTTLLFYYLYLVVQLPWILYLKTKVPDSEFSGEDDGNLREPLSAEIEALRFIAYKKLVWQRRLAFILTLVAPVLAGFGTFYLGEHIELVSSFTTKTHILLFVMAAELRPILHLFRSLTKETEKIISQASSSGSTAGKLEGRLAQVEARLANLDKVFVTKSELHNQVEKLQCEIRRLGQLVVRNYNKDKLETSRYDRLLNALQIQLDDLYQELFPEEHQHLDKDGLSLFKVATLPITLSISLIKGLSALFLFQPNQRPVLHLLPHRNDDS